MKNIKVLGVDLAKDVFQRNGHAVKLIGPQFDAASRP